MQLVLFLNETLLREALLGGLFNRTIISIDTLLEYTSVYSSIDTLLQYTISSIDTL